MTREEYIEATLILHLLQNLITEHGGLAGLTSKNNITPHRPCNHATQKPDPTEFTLKLVYNDGITGIYSETHIPNEKEPTITYTETTGEQK